MRILAIGLKRSIILDHHYPPRNPRHDPDVTLLLNQVDVLLRCARVSPSEFFRYFSARRRVAVGDMEPADEGQHLRLQVGEWLSSHGVTVILVVRTWSVARLP